MSSNTGKIETTTGETVILDANLQGEDSERRSVFNFSEDIWAVLIGGILILAVLLAAVASPGFKFSTPVFKWSGTQELLSHVLSAGNLLLLAGIGLIFAMLSSVAVGLSGGNIRKYATGFILIYVLGIAALVIAGNEKINYYGIEYVVFALFFGLLIGNLTVLPGWIREAARSEFFIKTGLIILGVSVLVTDIIKAGLPGILQAVLVVSVVWFFALWLCRKLKVDDEFGVILASAVSICGVSAAIVASGAIRGDKKKLSYITTLVLLVAIPMMILQPWIIKQFHIPEIVGGAWLGGTLDTTASVTAASQIVGPVAVKTGVIIKFSQNVLIGVAAFFIAGWWALRKTPGAGEATEGRGLKIIWDRFPKFVLGFIAVSLIFSFFIAAGTKQQVSGFLNGLRTIWFALAFVAIGLEARFADLVKIQGGRPALAFIAAQAFNVIWTLLWAYLLFGGILLPAPDIR